MGTMAKLEKVYQNKLNLKEVHPMIKEDATSVSSRLVSDKNPYYLISLSSSLSDLHLGKFSSLCLSFSEEELPNHKKEFPEENRMTCVKELINNI